MMRKCNNALICLSFFLITQHEVLVHGNQDLFQDQHSLDEEIHRSLGLAQRCNTRSVSKSEQEQVEEQIQAYKAGQGNKALASASNSTVEINVYFHVFTDTIGIGSLSNDVIEKQMNVLNNAFGGVTSDYSPCGFEYDEASLLSTPFVFNLVESTIIPDNSAFDLDQPSSEAKRIERRSGTCADLNIFTGKSTSLGFASFPFDCNLDSPTVDDSISISYRTFPEQSVSPYNEGDTLIHQVGHWLGLFHTFDGGCFDRDFVVDTPGQLDPTFGCPVGKDTCTAEGVDNIHNFMDYSDDCCMYTFTKGQIERMLLASLLYRGLSHTYTPSPTPQSNVETCSFPNDGFDYSNCNVPNPCYIGDNTCDDDPLDGYNNAECNFDGRDCMTLCEYPNDGFDYTACFAPQPCFIGDFFCDEDAPYNTEACNFDGGDCLCNFPQDSFDYSFCEVEFPCFLGDEHCDGDEYDTGACNFDGGDCSCNFPNDGKDYSLCGVEFHCWIGDGSCDRALLDYNTEECHFDGGDCDNSPTLPPTPFATPPPPDNRIIAFLLQRECIVKVLNRIGCFLCRFFEIFCV